MSFESEAFAPDEYSLLDLFGPEASPQAQDIVKRAAERSMDEMAVVINAATKPDSKEEASLNAASGSDLNGIPIGTMKTISPEDLLITDTDALSTQTLYSILTSSERGEEDEEGATSKEEYHFTTQFLNIDDLRRQALVLRGVEAHLPGTPGIPYGSKRTDKLWKILNVPTLAERMAAAYVPTSSTENMAAKDSLVSQLAHQLTLAIAKGADLTKISLTLNVQNPETSRIEPINIHAVDDEHPSDHPSLSGRAWPGLQPFGYPFKSR
ncbi:hypothetical protein [Pantoea agglomerans]|uniref:hypothetical protein n=1 Tax=Enterobacter agglomerans TaxID=549 RepID=UPI003C7CEF3E